LKKFEQWALTEVRNFSHFPEEMEPFELPGEVRNMAYKKGEKIGESVIKTAGDPVQLRLSRDRKSIKADNADLSYILIEAVDKMETFALLPIIKWK
jgi:hypothetical protein